MVLWCCAVFAAYATLVNGLSDSSQSRMQNHGQNFRNMAEMWSKTIQRKAQQKQQFSNALNLTASEGLSSEHLQKLMKDVASYAAAAKERFKLEIESGASNTDRDYHHRKALESIMKGMGSPQSTLTDEVQKTIRQVKKTDHWIADKASRLILLEVVQVLAALKVWDLGNDAKVLHGVLLAAMFFLSSVFVFWDAGFNLEEAVHITWTIPTTNGWGDWSYDAYDIEEIKPMQLWMTLHVGMSAMIGCLGLQSLADLLFWDPIIDHTVQPQNNDDPTQHMPAWVALHLGLYIGFIAIGGWFYSTYESCSCSYGYRAVPGCIDSDCENTGGLRMDLIDAIYMCVLSLGSVGFGDFSPSSWWGRVFGFPYFLIGNTQRFHLSMTISEGVGYFFGRARDGLHGRYD